MKILVTGGAGFIGSHIVDALITNNHQVLIVDNLSHGKKSNINAKATFYNMDIRDNKISDIFKEEKPEILIHNAAQISVPSSIADPLNDADINIMGSLNLLEAARKNGVKKIIFPSSAAMFGEPQYLPIDENHPLEMLSGYGVTKHTLNHYFKIYRELYNIDYVNLIYSNVYGPRQDSSGEGGVVSIFSEKMLENISPSIFGDGEQLRDFVYVKDVVRANLIALETNKSGLYNVCTNEKTSVNKLFDLFNELLNKNLKADYQPVRKGDINNSYMTYEKINKDLGWSPEYSLDLGLKETIEYYKEVLNIK